MNNKAASTLAAILCFITAFSLQIQVTLFASPTYLGLRINLTDLLAPFAGIAILATLLTKKSEWPRWRIKNIYLWLAGLTALLALALLHTHFTYGEISRWALINKIGGWAVLLSIMGMGGWVATNASKADIIKFVKFFLYFFLIIMVLQLGAMLATLFSEFARLNKYMDFPAGGLMANRNAYGFLFVTSLCLSVSLYFHRTRIIHPAIAHAICFFTPLFLMLNGSRATFLATLIILPTLLFMHRAQKRPCFNLVLFLLAGLALQSGISHFYKNQLIPVHNLDKYEFLERAGSKPEGILYPGDSMRITILKDAQTMVLENPVLGSGLGSTLLYQQKTHGEMINIIDCTPLWILVEMGAVGLFIFAAFYFRIFKGFFAAWKEDEEFSKTLHLSLMFILFAFTFMSLFHELLYMRFIWFFLGLGLALPARMRQDL